MWHNSLIVDRLTIPFLPLVFVDRSSCIFSCIYTLYALYTLDKEWRTFVGHRNAFLDAGDPDARGGNQLAYSVRLEVRFWSLMIQLHTMLLFVYIYHKFGCYVTHSILPASSSFFSSDISYDATVQSLPADLRSDLALRAYMERLFPGKIHSVVVNVNLGALQTLIDRRQVGIACRISASSILFSYLPSHLLVCILFTFSESFLLHRGRARTSRLPLRIVPTTTDVVLGLVRQ